ncbi:LAQU0S10e00870g1_1 [Lachancea quebecensis]|uniref:LAQU0S10e00870g1_1 n=1 Tax=Lachancea quebecensis TaxID=1654605 RepID=A0A0N7MLW9_9SACH|nr:LAQU0S10e00870g1_1 [Lachancea quebecensis]
MSNASHGSGEVGEPYNVGLTAESLSVFEVLNSLCVVENYDQLLYYLEARRSPLAVPPADVLIVMMTLSVIPSFGAANLEAEMDPYNVGRSSLATRSIKVLRYFMDVLLLDHGKDESCYSLALLRSQFFVMLDQLSLRGIPTNRGRERDFTKRRKTNSGVLLEAVSTAMHAEQSLPSLSFKNPYSSYVSCLEHRPEVLKNVPITIKLSQDGEFWNCVAWALYASLSDDTYIYERSKVWFAVLGVFFDAFELRNKHYIEDEGKLAANKTARLSFVERSPLTTLFRSLDAQDLIQSFCDVLFLGCNYELAGKLRVHCVYPKESMQVDTYVPKVLARASCKFTESMGFRHRLLGLFLSTLRSVPEGLELFKPCLSEANFVRHLGKVLSSFEDTSQLKHFFSVRNPYDFLDYMPLFAQAAANETLKEFEADYTLALVEKLADIKSMVEELGNVFEGCFPPLDEEYEGRPEHFYSSVEKCDIFLLVILRYWEYIHGAQLKMTHLRCTIRSLSASDQKRLEFAKLRGWDASHVPLLHDHFLSVLSISR